MEAAGQHTFVNLNFTIKRTKVKADRDLRHRRCRALSAWLRVLSDPRCRCYPPLCIVDLQFRLHTSGDHSVPFIESVKAAVKRVPLLYRTLKRVRRESTKRSLAKFREPCVTVGREVPNPTFVKVGANDGVTGDPCSDILLSGTAWKGLLIEPVPSCFEQLRDSFGDPDRFVLEQVAIGAKSGSVTFYFVDSEAALKSIPNLPSWHDQLGSFDKSHITKHLGGRLRPFIREMEVQVIPLNEALKRNNIRNAHLVHIDTEGHDFEVLKSLDFTNHSPVLIFIEHAHLRTGDKKSMRRFLQERGYSVRDCGGDYFGLHKEASRALHRKTVKTAS